VSVEWHDIYDNNSISINFSIEQTFITMGFADLSIEEIAAEYNLSAQEVFNLCDRLGITYKNQQTCLALEDAKAVISQILSRTSEAKTKKKFA
jgi:predicted DNA-binding protein YlxM (UPF0122 family)